MTVFDKLIRSCKQEGLYGTGKAIKERVIDDTVAYLIRWLQLQLACDLPTNLPDTIRIGHPTGIVIGANAELGDNILIYQNVTIGNKSKAATNFILLSKIMSLFIQAQ
jgi:serine acetyltransferase